MMHGRRYRGPFCNWSSRCALRPPASTPRRRINTNGDSRAVVSRRRSPAACTAGHASEAAGVLAHWLQRRWLHGAERRSTGERRGCNAGSRQVSHRREPHEPPCRARGTGAPVIRCAGAVAIVHHRRCQLGCQHSCSRFCQASLRVELRRHHGGPSGVFVVVSAINISAFHSRKPNLPVQVRSARSSHQASTASGCAVSGSAGPCSATIAASTRARCCRIEKVTAVCEPRPRGCKHSGKGLSGSVVLRRVPSRGTPALLRTRAAPTLCSRKRLS